MELQLSPSPLIPAGLTLPMAERREPKGSASLMRENQSNQCLYYNFNNYYVQITDNYLKGTL